MNGAIIFLQRRKRTIFKPLTKIYLYFCPYIHASFLALISSLLIGLSPLEAVPVTLEWDAVTTNQDDTPLTDLAGYRLFYQNTSFNKWGGMTVAEALADSKVKKVITVGSKTSITVDLDPGQNYFFRFTAYDTSGNNSGFNVDGSGNDVEISWFGPMSNAAPKVDAGVNQSIKFRNIFKTYEDSSVDITYKVDQESPVEIILYDQLGACGPKTRKRNEISRRA